MTAALQKIALGGIYSADDRLHVHQLRIGVAIEALADDALPFGDKVAIPTSTVLLSQDDESAVRCRSGRAARLDQQHEREQAHRLRFPGHELDQEPSQPDRLGAELLANQTVAGARRVTLVEDQIDDRENSA